jgi:tetratricopeptide (TPR) repeat protein
LPPDLLPKITQLTPEAFDNNRVHWGLKIGATWKLLGDLNRSKAYADSAVMAVEAQLRNFPDDAQLHELRGRSLALAGRKAEAVQEAEQSLRMRETTLDAITGPYYRFQVVRILLQVGEYERAIEELKPLVDRPGLGLTRAYLRIDPGFKPLRGNPRFERLIAPTT